MFYTGCGKLTSFFEYEMPYEKRSYLAAPFTFLTTSHFLQQHNGARFITLPWSDGH
jgi:hypothetical protein